MKKKRGLTTWGKEVKKKALEQDTTLVELAETIGTSKQYLNRIMYGQRSGEKYRQQIITTLGMGEKWE